MGGASSDLVAQSLGRDDGVLVTETLVGLEVQGQETVVFFDECFACTLDGFGTDTAL